MTIGKKRRGPPRSREDRVVGAVSNLILGLVIVVCLYPFLNIVAKSFSSEGPILAGEVYLLPVGFTTKAYEIVLGSARFWNAAASSVFVTVVGTVLNLVLTAFVAFALSRKNLPGQKLIAMLYIFTMLFGGGLIPTYLVVSSSGLYNTLWALIIPGLVSPFNLILMRNYFLTIPESLEESAKLDGAGHFVILFRIVIPLALPSIATIGLFCAVAYWNEYFSALIYINNRSIVPIQVYLREILLNAGSADLNNMDLMLQVAQEAVRGATVLAATVPILLVYPFLQKYYIQGMTVGAVKE